MTGLLLLTAVLAAPDAGVPSHAPAHAAHPTDAGVRPRPADAGVVHGDIQRTSPDGGHAAPVVHEGGTRVTAVDGAPEPPTHVSVQEPARPDAGTSRRKKARADRTDGQGDPQTDALLEQSRAQTEALQQIAAQQRAAEEARYAEQQARMQRAAQVDDARSAIDGTVQSLQTSGNWSSASLESTRQSLQQTAAAASAAGSPAEARNAAEAARMIEAAQAALAQKNAQQAQWYLMQANQLLSGAQGGGGVRY